MVKRGQQRLNVAIEVHWQAKNQIQSEEAIFVHAGNPCLLDYFYLVIIQHIETAINIKVFGKPRTCSERRGGR